MIITVTYINYALLLSVVHLLAILLPGVIFVYALFLDNNINFIINFHRFSN